MAQWDVKNKTFVITGGASGLGAEYAKGFLNLGAKKIAILDIAEELGKVTTKRLNKQYGNKVVFLKCDVSKEDEIIKAFDIVVAQFKQVDVLINNAGIMNDHPEVWRLASDVNWQGVVSFTLKGVKHMRKDEGGSGGTIINIASTAALKSFEYQPIYQGSKAAVVNFSQSLAMEPFYEKTGVRVLTFCPGGTDTLLVQNLETKSYDPQLGSTFAKKVEENDIPIQKVESAVAAMLEMYKIAAPRTIWISTKDKPVKDLTSVIEGHFAEIKKIINEI